MGKSDEEAIAQFNKYVNMSPEELQKWLDNPQSKEAGTGVGIESGHKIVNILRKNPSKDPKKYDEVSRRARQLLMLRVVNPLVCEGGYPAYTQSRRVYQPPSRSRGSFEGYEDARGVGEDKEYYQVNSSSF